MSNNLELTFSNTFKRDMKKWGKDIMFSSEWIEVLYCLIHQIPLDKKYLDHPLKGEYKGTRECHIKPDLLLIYRQIEDNIILIRIGTHSELF